jgi:hypothetical protein
MSELGPCWYACRQLEHIALNLIGPSTLEIHNPQASGNNMTYVELTNEGDPKGRSLMYRHTDDGPIVLIRTRTKPHVGRWEAAVQPVRDDVLQMKKAPRRRRIASDTKPLDVSESESEAILEAINAERTSQCYSVKNWRGEVEREASTTSFIDPITGARRWAVECVSGASRWVLDFRNESDASEFFRNELARLGI